MRLLFRVLLLISVLLLLSTVGVIGFFMQDQRALLDRAEVYFKEVYQLDLQIGGATVSSWNELPCLRVSMEEVSLRHPEDAFSTFQLGTIDLDLKVTYYWQTALRLDSLSLREGIAQLQANSPVVHTIQDWVQQNRSQSADEQSIRVALADRWSIRAEQLQLVYRDTVRAKHMEGTINLMRAKVEKADTTIIAQVNTDLLIDRLTFNPTKGSYLEHTRLRMQPEVRYENERLVLPTFDLWLEEECFTAVATLDINGGGYFTLDLQNETTPFAATVAQVPEVLQKKLSRYTITKPLATRIRVSGGFAAGDNPVARIDFQTSNNQFGLTGYPQLEQVTAKGYLINRVARDSSGWELEHPLNLRLHFEQLAANYTGIKMEFPHLEVSSTPQEPVFLDGSLLASGNVRPLNDFLPNRDWRLTAGEFSLQTSFAGAIDGELDLLRSLESTELDLAAVRLHKTGVHGSALNLRQAQIRLEGDSLHLRDALITLPASTKAIALSGYWVTNWPWRNSQDPPIIPASYVSCHSPFLNVDTLMQGLALFNASGEKPVRLHSVAQWTKSFFNPRMEWQIDSLQLRQDAVQDITLKVSLDKEANLQVERLSGTIEANQIDCSGTVSLVPEQPAWNMAVLSRGSASWFNRLFDNNTFFFEQGAYLFSGSIDGPVEHWSDLRRHTKGKLALWDGEVLLGPTAVRVPLKELRVDYGGDHLKLDALQIPLSSGGEIELAGEVTNFRSLLTPEADAADVSSTVQMKAGRLDLEDLYTIFSSVQRLAEGRSSAEEQAIKPSLQEIYRKFHPCLELQIDTFQFQQFTSTGNLAHIGFLDENRMVFNNTVFEFKGRPVQLSATADIRDASETPFEVQVETERFDLAALVETYDYFGLTSLQRAERVAGRVSLRADLQGKLIDSIGLQKDQLLGRIHFNLHEAELVNFEPIKEIANKFFRTERLRTIRFAPITDTLYITHRVVHIPRMEIQSTAFNLFVEGHLNYDNNTNIWVSLPWQNLKSWQEGELPAKTGYAESGGKLFVEIRDRDGEMQYRLRLTNKRLYKHRGILDQYRSDKREERAIRRAWRKDRRRARRAGA